MEWSSFWIFFVWGMSIFASTMWRIMPIGPSESDHDFNRRTKVGARWMLGSILFGWAMPAILFARLVTFLWKESELPTYDWRGILKNGEVERQEAQLSVVEDDPDPKIRRGA